MNDLKLIYPPILPDLGNCRPLTSSERLRLERDIDTFKTRAGSYSPYDTLSNGDVRRVVVRGSEFKNDGVMLELHEPRFYRHHKYNSEYSGRVVKQHLREHNGLVSKKNSIIENGQELYSSVHIQDRATGLESVTRTKGGKIIGGYEVLPLQRKLATGLKGKVEKLGMAVATDANGCERPILRRVGGFILNLAKRIK